MQLAAPHPNLAPALAGAADLVGAPVITARFDWNDGSERAAVARFMIGRRAGYESVDAAVHAARLHQRTAPSKQWPDLAIAVVRDDATAGYALLELDQTLSSWEGGEWWQASSWTPRSAAVEAVVNGRGQLVEPHAPAS